MPSSLFAPAHPDLDFGLRFGCIKKRAVEVEKQRKEGNRMDASAYWLESCEELTENYQVYAHLLACLSRKREHRKVRTQSDKTHLEMPINESVTRQGL